MDHDSPAKSASSAGDILNPHDFPYLNALAPGPHAFADVQDPEILRENNHRVIDEREDSFGRLRDSILMSGVREPIQLHYLRKQQQLVILAGHRRVRAVLELRRAGLQVVLPALVMVSSAEETILERLARASAVAVTNFSSLRQDLRGVEKARAIAQFMQESGITSITSAARVLGVDRKTIERSLNLLLLPEDLQQLMLTRAQKISERRAWDLASEYKAMLKAGMPAEEAQRRIHIHILAAAAEERPRVVRQGCMRVDLNRLEKKLEERSLPADTIEEVLTTIREMNGTDTRIGAPADKL